MTAPMKKIIWCVIYLSNKSKHIVQLHLAQKYMDVAFISKWDQKGETQVTCSKMFVKEPVKQYSTKNVMNLPKYVSR